jgi:spore coat polysaccharide biosynthesis protein SpsF
MSGASVIVRCDGGAEIGMGHVSRGLALADALRQEHAVRVAFAMRGAGSAGAAAVRAAGYPVEPIDAPDDADYGDTLVALASSHGAGAIVVDVRDALSRASLAAVRASGVRVVTNDDASDRRLAADLAFYPPVPQVDELDWTGFAGQRFVGWEWVLLKREFASGASARAAHASDANPGARALPPPIAGNPVSLGESPERQGRQPSGDGAALSASPAIDILVTMGGSDPAGMTEFTVDALNLLPMPLAVQVVVGPAFARPNQLVGAIVRSPHAVRVVQSPSSMASLMRASRVAVASFGVSAYELAACGVPAVHLCLSPDHARSASAFEREQIAVSLGVFPGVRPNELSAAVARLIGDAGCRMRMSARALALVDGQGAARVARLVVDRMF